MKFVSKPSKDDVKGDGCHKNVKTVITHHYKPKIMIHNEIDFYYFPTCIAFPDKKQFIVWYLKLTPEK